VGLKERQSLLTDRLLAEFEEIFELGIRELGEPAFTGAHYLTRDAFLALDHFVDSFFQGTGATNLCT